MKAKSNEKDNQEPFEFDTFKIKTLEDFEIYNSHVRRANIAAGKTVRSVKVPDESFHKKVKVKFQRFDQPQNVLKTRVRNKDIDWKGELKPGQIYDLPIPVVKFLNSLAVPIFAEVKVEDGSSTKTITKQVGETSRFSCQLLDIVP